MGSRKRGKSGPNQRKLLIGDDLLIEILSRIPTPVVAIRCKLVCKGWCSLISSHYFISRFKQQHVMHGSRYPKPLLGMLANTIRRVSMEENPDDHEFNFRGFNLDYIPKKNGKIVVLASCNDLILCRESCTYNYCYLCNPFTMQWVSLPHPPTPTKPEDWIIRTGLVCEPNNRGPGGTIDDGFRYRIVRFHYNIVSVDCLATVVDMYCSETSEWIRCDELDTDLDTDWSESKIAGYNGKLYWVKKGGQYLISYDPFYRTQTSLRLNNGVVGGNVWDMNRSHVEECEGVLRVTRLERLQSSERMSVWELQEGEAIFKEHIVFNQEDIWGVAGFHPRNKDVLFLTSRKSLVSFNTKTREFTVETQFLNYPSPYVFTLQLPWWPTLIPSPSPILLSI